MQAWQGSAKLEEPLCQAKLDAIALKIGSLTLSICARINNKGVISMSSRSAEVLKEALSLPPAERVEIAERLLSSLDPPTQKAIDVLWGTEAEERLDAFERGEIKAVSAKQVFERLGKKPV
jgi:putative addiction module component (TIGR02574 family)